jgi:hypothetical protein
VILVWLVLIAGAVVSAVVFDARWVVAPVLGLLVARVGIGALRGMAQAAVTAPPAPPEPKTLAADERIVFSCQDCGTEVLLLVEGEPNPPRHCGEGMRRRTEVPRMERWAN